MKNKALVLIAAIAISGCSAIQTKNIETLSAHSGQLTKNIDQVLTEFYDGQYNKSIDLNIEPTNKIQSEDALETLYKENVAQFDNGKHRSALSIIKATKALNQYFASLQSLASVQNKEKFAETGYDMAEALVGLDKAYKSFDKDSNLLKKEDAALIGKLVSSATYFWSKNEAAKAIKKIVIKTDPEVQTMLAAIKEQLSAGLIQRGIVNSRRVKLNTDLKGYRRMGAQMSTDERREALKDLVDQYHALNQVSKTMKSAEKSVKTLASTHKALAESLKDDKYNGKKILKSLTELKDEIDFFNSVEKDFNDCETSKLKLTDDGLVCDKSE